MSDLSSKGRRDEAARIVAGVDTLVQRDHSGRFTLARPSEWRVIPMEGSSHLSRQDVARFASAFKWLGATKVHAVALELRDEVDPVRDFPASEAGLDAFNQACAHFNCALTTKDCAALIICTTDDYMVICGSEQFVRQASGASPEAALEKFYRYATDTDWKPPVRNMLESVWSSLASAAERVTFPALGHGH
jgi:hypothetical protein